MQLRFSKATTLFITGIISLLELTLATYPYIIPLDPVRYFVIGLLPITINFLYQEEGLEPVPSTIPNPVTVPSVVVTQPSVSETKVA